MADCPSTARAIQTNADLVGAILDGRHDLAACNADKSALRAWASSVSK